ncbi:hypothetical protein KH5_23420 [Urechidicola sp. KH5]
MALDKDATIPLGTFISCAGIIALPQTVYWGVYGLRTPKNKLHKLLSILLKTCIVLGILWMPISYFLAGNISFTFIEKITFQGGQSAMRWFWRLNYGIAIGSIATLLVYWISLLFKPKNNTRNIY